MKIVEQFTRGENPIKSLNIGKRAQIEKWFKIWAPDAKYEIDDDLNIRVKESLWFRKTKITFLPDNLHVEGFIYLEGTKITSLPNNLYVGESLDLRWTKITSLPDDLYVDNWLDIKQTKITALPNNLHIGGEIYKDF